MSIKNIPANLPWNNFIFSRGLDRVSAVPSSYQLRMWNIFQTFTKHTYSIRRKGVWKGYSNRIYEGITQVSGRRLYNLLLNERYAASYFVYKPYAYTPGDFGETGDLADFVFSRLPIFPYIPGLEILQDFSANSMMRLSQNDCKLSFCHPELVEGSVLQSLDSSFHSE